MWIACEIRCRGEREMSEHERITLLCMRHVRTLYM